MVLSPGANKNALRKIAHYWAAWLILIIALLAISGIYAWARNEIHKRQQNSFNQAMAKFRHTMELHFSAYNNILNGLNAFCAQDKEVLANDFIQYLEAQGIRNDHEGIYDMGYIGRLRASDRGWLETYALRQGIAATNLVKFNPAQEEQFVLLLWDNFRTNVIPAAGSHLYTDPDRLIPMENARDKAEISCSGKLTIRLGAGNVGSNGFMLFAPVYQHGKPLGTVAERRQALKGFTFISFSVPDYWGKIYRDAGEPMIDFEVYDGQGRQADKLWFDCDNSLRGAANIPASTRPRFENFVVLGGMGREWTFYYASRPSFENTPEVKIPGLILAVGLAVSAALFGLALTQSRARNRAEGLARQLRTSHKAMAEEKERLAVTMTAIADGVIAVDTRGNTVLMNRAAEKLTGWPQSEAHGQPLDAILIMHDPATQNQEPCPVDEVLATGNDWRAGKPVRLQSSKENGPLVRVAISAMQDAHGGILGAVVTIRDVTERQKLIEEQMKSSRLESIGLLAGGIAHDFNNILTAILGNISMAAMDAGDNPEVRGALREAGQACARARDLTQQLLTFAKGGAPLRTTARLEDVICESARFATHGSNARCEYHLPADLWPVEADKGQISQVIHNLVINAVQAMPEGGVINITAQNQVLEDSHEPGLPPGRYVNLAIQDHGMGIRPEHLDKIFDPYFSTKQRGSGLGLATAYSIIKRHDGAIRVNSRLGAGTRVDLYLPASDKNPSPPTQPVLPVARSGSGRILVMDDEPMILNMLSQMLRKLGYQAIRAADGAEAARLYAEAQSQSQPFAAVILDLTVPGGVGGQQAVKQLREIDPTVKAIVSSGYSNDPVVADFQAYGFQAMIPKPYGLDNLARVLGEVLAQSTTPP